jgi:hypothetical protein
MQETCPIHGKAVDHSPMECRQTLDLKKKMAAKNKICFNCGSAGHFAIKCFVVKACSDCSQPHHPMFCPRNQKNPSANGGNGAASKGKKQWPKKGGKPKGQKRVSFAENSDSDESDEKVSETNGMTIVSKHTNPRGANTSGSSGSR